MQSVSASYVCLACTYGLRPTPAPPTGVTLPVLVPFFTAQVMMSPMLAYRPLCLMHSTSLAPLLSVTTKRVPSIIMSARAAVARDSNRRRRGGYVQTISVIPMLTCKGPADLLHGLRGDDDHCDSSGALADSASKRHRVVEAVCT